MIIFSTRPDSQLRWRTALILTVGAVLGVRAQTEKFVDLIKDNNLPCLICVTKMDRERANFQKTVAGIREATGLNPVILYLPIGAEDAFEGVVDILANKALLFTEGGKAEVAEIPADLADEVGKSAGKPDGECGRNR